MEITETVKKQCAIERDRLRSLLDFGTEPKSKRAEDVRHRIGHKTLSFIANSASEEENELCDSSYDSHVMALWSHL